MQIGTSGLITDHFGKVLLVRRDNSRTWTLPGGLLAPGELPDDGVVREVEEETGLKVLPGRLVGIYYRATDVDEHLVFTFRCLVHGGEIVTSLESPQIGYAGPAELPRPMLAIHRERVERGAVHGGGRPYWGVQELSGIERLVGRVVMPLVYGWRDWRRQRQGEPAFERPPAWSVAAFVVIRDEADQVVWVRRAERDVWRLPGGPQEPGEPPWATAVRACWADTGLDVELTNLSGVDVGPGQNELSLTFSGNITGGELTPGPGVVELGRYGPGREPASSRPQDVEKVADVVRPWDATLFRRQEGSADDAGWAFDET